MGGRVLRRKAAPLPQQLLQYRCRLRIVPLLLQRICVRLGVTLVVRPILIGLGIVRQRLVQAELQGEDAGAAKVILRGAIDVPFVGLDEMIEDRTRLLQLAFME